MAPRFTGLICVLALCLLAGQASAARGLKESMASRGLKQVGDAFTRWGSGGTIDDGSRQGYSQYARVVRSAAAAARRGAGA